jgi:serine/threonine protein kinase
MYRGSVRGSPANPELLEFLQDPDRAFSDPSSTIIKDSNTTSSCTVSPIIGGEQKSFHIKRFNYQNTFYALKYLFRTSRAKRVWKVAQNLIASNIPTPLPISFLEQRQGRLLIKSFFISKNIDRALPLNRAIHELEACRSSRNTSQKKRLIQQVAYLVRSLHECGICHRDLKASNILVQKNPGQIQKLYLTDLDSARLQTRVRAKERIRDLARLNASLFYTKSLSTADRIRFLRDYLRTRSPRDAKLHLYWKAIAKHTLKKLRPNRIQGTQ